MNDIKEALKSILHAWFCILALWLLLVVYGAPIWLLLWLIWR